MEDNYLPVPTREEAIVYILNRLRGNFCVDDLILDSEIRSIVQEELEVFPCLESLHGWYAYTSRIVYKNSLIKMNKYLKMKNLKLGE